MYNYKRRLSTECHVGGVTIGGANPIRLQSMTNTNTNDVSASVAQIERIVEAGADLVRLTAQGTREALALRDIEDNLRRRGHAVPLVADIHFNAAVADVAAGIVEKVRINPGNYVDPGRTFRKLSYTDAEYAEEIEKIRRRFVPFLHICKEHHTAVRIGVNHGSLSDRIMSRYGDTPAGIVESCMEFLRICRDEDFSDVVISIKASNTVVMVTSMRLLVREMEREGMNYPLHLGVTEAGDGEDGRIKSAVGIGALLADGIGDTIRVSLSEAPEAEIPVARALRDYIVDRHLVRREMVQGPSSPAYDPCSPSRLPSLRVGQLGDGQPVQVCGLVRAGADVCIHGMANYSLQELLYDDSVIDYLLEHPDVPVIARSNGRNPIGVWRAFIFTLRQATCRNPIVLSRDYSDYVTDWEQQQLYAAADFGVMLIDQLCDGILINNDNFAPEQMVRLAFDVLQASRARFTKTEYISCPSCGRTLFDLQTAVARIKAATAEAAATDPRFKTLKIGIMGCIVNGPGEMADADYGYVGAGPGRVSLYKSKVCVEKGIPEEEAVAKLIDFIRRDLDRK